jgi:hypothetical protein
VALLHGCAGVTGCSASPWTPEGPDLESLPLRLNFTAQQHHFYPNIEQTPDGFTHLGFVGLLRKRVSFHPRRALPPRASPLLNSATQQHHPNKYRTNPRWFYPSGVRSIERRI